MDTPGSRLKQAREKAGWPSARNAAVNMNWTVSTYGSHERAGEPGGREFGREDAEKYARAFRTSAAWLLTGDERSAPVEPAFQSAAVASVPPRARPAANASAPLAAPEFSRKRLPVYGVAVGGFDGRFMFNGDLVDTVPCPPGLENVPNAYAVYVAGDSMAPRFKAGETVWVHPAKPPRRGDDVVVQMQSASEPGMLEGFIKEFVGWTPTRLILTQHNPKEEVELDRDTVVSVHTIVGSLKT